jgi:hypothetical protein
MTIFALFGLCNRSAIGRIVFINVTVVIPHFRGQIIHLDLFCTTCPKGTNILNVAKVKSLIYYLVVKGAMYLAENYFLFPKDQSNEVVLRDSYSI